MNLPPPAQWTADLVIAVGNDLQRRAEKVRAAISQTNGQLIALQSQAQTIEDPDKRTRALAAIRDAVREQGRQATAYRALGDRFVRLWAQVRTWAREHGIAAPGLGALPLVPIAFAVGLIAIVASLAILERMTGPQAQLVREMTATVAAYRKGEMTLEAFEASAAALNAQAKQQRQASEGDPFGVSQIAEKLLPIGLVVLGIVVLPHVLDAIGASRSRRRMGAFA